MTPLAGFALISIGALIGASIAHGIQLRRKKSESSRIADLADYLEAASLGQAEVIASPREDGLSKLQDEIGKTVSSLNRLRRQALEEKEAYARNLANIAHQIRTPLTSLYIIAQQIPSSDRDEEPIARSIERQLDRMSMLQEDLILMAKLDSGTLRLNRSAHDMFTLLNAAADSVEDIAKDADVRIAIVNDDPIDVDVDEHWTCEAISNILKNCIEHSRSGSVVEVAYDGNPLYAEITIADAGIGFDEDELAHLFERFYVGRGHSSGSTGLGLSFSRELLELQGGTIRISNGSDGGARFSIRFYRH